MPYRNIEVLRVGKYRLPDGRWFVTTPETNARVCEQANKQLKAGIRHPAAWMHDPKADPVYLSGGPQQHKDAWLAKGYFGEAHKFVTDPSGTVWAKVLIHDEDDARQFDKVRQVSPGLYPDWVDEKGVRWPEMTVMHIAATPKPIQRDIGTGKPPLYLSQPAVRPGLICLSYPVNPRSSAMAEEKGEMEIEVEGGEAASVDIGEVIELLKKLDIHGMDGVTEATLVPALKAAVHTKLGDTGEADADGADDMDEMGEEVLTDAPPPVLMSNALTRLAKYEVAEKNAKLDAALKAGKLSKPQHAELHKRVNGVNLSQPADLFNADGTMKRSEVDVILETLEMVAAGPLAKTPLTKRADLGHKVVDASNPNVEQTDDEKRAEFRKEVKKRLGKK